jgi:hypothetical protein
VRRHHAGADDRALLTPGRAETRQGGDQPQVRGGTASIGLAALAECKHLALDIKASPAGVSGFVPLRPLYRIEHVFAQLGRWRRLSRCYEGTEASARAWLEVASVGHLAWRATA